jgi:uncharacterized protein
MPPPSLDDAEIEELQGLLDRVPAPLEALDVCMLDGFLCGVLVQRTIVPAVQWLPYVTDIEGRGLPAAFDARRLQSLVLRRHAELEHAIARRGWFDPWVFELAATPSEDPGRAAAQAVYPWVAGFAAAMNAFPGLLRSPAALLNEPLALLYRHLDADDLEDADALLEAIAASEAPQDLAEAVEDLVRATLLLADVGRPIARRPAVRRRHTR